MEQILKSLTLDFFGKGKHKISPEKFFKYREWYFVGCSIKRRSKGRDVGSKTIYLS